MRCGDRAALWILSCASGSGVVLGAGFGLDCVWDFGVGLGGALCFVVLEG